ncbi:hypothetical protein RI129_005118 [Pyrocoelia pectoralis]|uniref:Dopa decarboxylase n=1 Tax=Pyrocoelia pectoralis TaxID=417401 RepID=A0AAN7VMT9_9COLE
MDVSEFREFGKAVVDHIADYWESLPNRHALPVVKPGDIAKSLPSKAPVKGEHWEEILKDIDSIIQPGLTHWQSPNFHGYFPSGHSFPSIVGELLTAGFGCMAFNWMGSPAGTELEITMMNWLGQALGLPQYFLNCDEGPGGGVIHGSASEAVLVALLAARDKTLNSFINKQNGVRRSNLRENLVAYTSDQANSCIEKAAKIASVTIKQLKTHNCQLRGSTLRDEIFKDKANGFVPCIVIATMGTTGTCACDCLDEIGQICKEENIWFHIDAAYAGSAMICPEYRPFMGGVELSDSINVSPHKWMLVNYDCTATWFRDHRYVIDSIGVKRVYLDDQSSEYGIDYHNWQTPLGRRIRSIKLWFVLRSYGIEGIQRYIRNHVALAKYFEQLVNTDSRFEVCSSCMGLVSFRLKRRNSLTELLLKTIIDDGKYYYTPYKIGNKFVIRFAVCTRITKSEDIKNAWNAIVDYTNTMQWDLNGTHNGFIKSI